MSLLKWRTSELTKTGTCGQVGDSIWVRDLDQLGGVLVDGDWTPVGLRRLVGILKIELISVVDVCL